MKPLVKPDLKSDLQFSYDHRKCVLVDVLIGYVIPPNCVHY